MKSILHKHKSEGDYITPECKLIFVNPQTVFCTSPGNNEDVTETTDPEGW